MKNIGEMMKQVQELQTRMQDMQAKMEQTTATGQSGGGLVKVTLNGRGRLTDTQIDPSLLNPDEKQILEDLLVAAHEDAKTKIEQTMAEQFKQVTGGLPMPPGFQLPF